VSRHSLRLRLLLIAALATGLAVLIAAFGLVALFDRHVERRIDAELETYLRQLAADIAVKPDGSVGLTRSLAEPRFEEPYSGLYWQVQDKDRRLLLRSRSLWDTELALPASAIENGAVYRHSISGPQKTQLIAAERSISYSVPGGPQLLRLVVALDRRDLDRARQDFAIDIVPFLALLTAAFLVAVWFQVGIGLRPLHKLRQGLQAVRAGTTARLDGRFPDEVESLVQEVNDLLQAQEEAIDRARSRAADLAHGLKTPLTVLTADAAQLLKKGEVEISTELTELANAMRRQVDLELVRARIDATRRAAHPPQPLAPIAARLIRTLQRTPKGGALIWSCAIQDKLAVAVDPDDLAEMLGNLLDNAQKWAIGEVRLTAGADDGEISILVEDDGPGAPIDKIATLGQRGVRLDRTVQGSGRGLAIVSDIASAYGGRLEITSDHAAPLALPPHGQVRNADRRPLKGLRAMLRFPGRVAVRESHGIS